MPIRAARSIVNKLSYHYYKYGKLVSSKSHILLAASVSFVSYFSFSIIQLNDNILSLDAQCWHASAHIQFSKSNSPTHYLTQIRLSQPLQPVNFELIQNARKIYETILDNILPICYKHNGHCLVHAPPFIQFNNEHEWISNTNAYLKPYYVNPYAVYSNISFDQNGKYIKSDAISLTFILNPIQHGNTLETWDNVIHTVKSKYSIHDFQSTTQSRIWSASPNILPYMIQYKFNVFPFDISGQVQFSVIAYICTFYTVSIIFGKSNLVKSGYIFGFAAIFLSIATFTTTLGIIEKFELTIDSVPWYLLISVIHVGCLENIFIFSNVVLNTDNDMVVTEKVSKGLQSVGVPMTATLIAELLILNVGSYMDSDLIQEFCTFIKIAITIEYMLELTFMIAILSIDIKGIELTDLYDSRISNKLHEHEAQQSDKLPFIPEIEENKPISEPSTKQIRELRTHRIFNAFMLCLMLLLLSLFCKNDHHHKSVQFIHQPDLSHLSNQFWNILNLQKDTDWLQIQPPQLFVYDTDIHLVKEHLDDLEKLYQIKSLKILEKINYQPTLFRLLILSAVERIFVAFIHINIPVLILCIVMITIITWMTPKWRKQWLVPLLIHCFNQFFLTIFKFLPKLYVNPTIQVDNLIIINIPNIKQVKINTLAHQHLDDIRFLDANKQSIVSYGQDGRLVLWSQENFTWLARLDKLNLTRSGHLQATFNQYKKHDHHHHHHHRKIKQSILSKPHTIKINKSNKWVASDYNDGFIRIWNVNTGILEKEIDTNVHLQPIYQHYSKYRILFMEFIEILDNIYLLSVHKNGVLCEWDIQSGNCIQIVLTGHTKDITKLLVVPRKQWIISSSRDGTIKCWQRFHEQPSWNLFYTITLSKPIMSIDVTFSVKGLGILVAGSNDGTVKTWYLETGEPICTLSHGSLFNKSSRHSTLYENEELSDSDDMCDFCSTSMSNHQSPIYQVAATRCRCDNRNCGGCNTCFSFLVASSSYDYKVHIWRLSVDSESFKKRNFSSNSQSSNDDSDSILYSPSLRRRRRRKRQTFEQFPLPFKPVFLGRIEQPAGRGILFYDDILIGTRKRGNLEWEAWFASLQYFNPPTIGRWKIPIETLNLDDDRIKQKKNTHPSSLLIDILNNYRGTDSIMNAQPEQKYDSLETSELLPFSEIRHIVPIDGIGLACDFGNFIKLIYLDKPTNKYL